MKIKINYLNFLLYFSVFVIASVFVIEYVFLILPCKICYYQRIPYYIIICMGLVNLIYKGKYYEILFLWVCVILFITNATLGFYHMGIEYGWFSNIFNCVSNNNQYYSIEELKNDVIGTISVPCEDSKFKFIFTLSGWNFFMSLGLGILSFYYILHGKYKCFSKRV